MTVLVVALAVHLLVIAATPRVVMWVAARRIEDRAGGTNAWVHAERVTPRSQQVVRSSPDLAYSACAWDLTEGPVRISAPAWGGYFSLSLYDDRSENFFVANNRDAGGEGVDLVLATPGQAAELPADRPSDLPSDLDGSGARLTVAAPSSTGVALLRYLAPTPSAFARADEARRSAVCDAWSP